MRSANILLKPLFWRYPGKYYKVLFRSNAVNKMTMEDAVNIKHLRNLSKVRDILRVYSDKKFNDKKHGLTEEQKRIVISSLLNSKGHEQFHCGCDAFCKIDLDDFYPDYDSLIYTISCITTADFDFQAYYANMILGDCYLGDKENILKIVGFVTNADSEEDANIIYENMYELGISAINDGTTPDVDRLIKNFAQKNAKIKKKL